LEKSDKAGYATHKNRLFHFLGFLLETAVMTWEHAISSPWEAWHLQMGYGHGLRPLPASAEQLYELLTALVPLPRIESHAYL